VVIVEKFNHIMFLPAFGSIDADLALNLAAIILFMGVYIWHVKHDHRHNEKMIGEIRLLRKDINRMKKS
jgi:hypothetical protein